MKKLKLRQGYLRINREEYLYLGEHIEAKYKQEAGQKEFNSYRAGYEELVCMIRDDILDLISDGYKIFDKGFSLSEEAIQAGPVPHSVFQKLYYIARKEDAEEVRIKASFIDLCYIFVWRETRLAYLRQNKELISRFKLNKEIESSKYKFHIFFIANDLEKVKQLKDHIINVLGQSCLLINIESISQGINPYLRIDRFDDQDYAIIFASSDFFKKKRATLNLIEYLFESQDSKNDIFNDLAIIILSENLAKSFEEDTLQFEITEYWSKKKELIEDKISKFNGRNPNLKNLMTLMNRYELINNHIFDLVNMIDQKSYLIHLSSFQNITSIEEFENTLLTRETADLVTDNALEEAYNSIEIPSNSNPEKPEFPPNKYYRPSFPASTIHKIIYKSGHTLYIKDESTNPTGTHKDRFAWEVLNKYKAFRDRVNSMNFENYPDISIISSGSAAIAIQHLFNLYSIPTQLKVVHDKNLHHNILSDLNNMGCKTYETDLDGNLLRTVDIKKICANVNGIDITNRQTLDPNMDNYYDWLSYEILNQNPTYCFIPFGTGDLYINILNIAKKEHYNSFSNNSDRRFSGDLSAIRQCNFVGVRTNNKNSKLDKLYTKFLPRLNEYKQFINRQISNEIIGTKSTIIEIDEEFVEEAISVAEEKNISCEPSGIAGFAGFLKYKDKILLKEKILIINTGKTKSFSELSAFYNEKQIKLLH